MSISSSSSSVASPNAVQVPSHLHLPLAQRQLLVDVRPPYPTSHPALHAHDAVFCHMYGEIHDAHLLLPDNEAFTPGDMPDVPPPQPLIYDRNTEQAKYMM